MAVHHHHSMDQDLGDQDLGPDLEGLGLDQEGLAMDGEELFVYLSFS